MSQLRLHLHLFSSGNTLSLATFTQAKQQACSRKRTKHGLKTPELVSNCRTVTASVSTTPGHDRAIFQNRSEGKICGVNLAHTLQLILNCRTVTAKACIAPGNDGSICHNGSKGPTRGLNLLHAPELISKCQTVPAKALHDPR